MRIIIIINKQKRANADPLLGMRYKVKIKRQLLFMVSFISIVSKGTPSLSLFLRTS